VLAVSDCELLREKHFKSKKKFGNLLSFLYILSLYMVVSHFSCCNPRNTHMGRDLFYILLFLKILNSTVVHETEIAHPAACPCFNNIIAILFFILTIFDHKNTANFPNFEFFVLDRAWWEFLKYYLLLSRKIADTFHGMP